MGKAARAVVVLVAAISWAGAAQAQDSATIGVVLDGPWERSEALVELLQTEIEALVTDVSVTFPGMYRLEADYTLEGIREAVEQLLADPEVDLILTLGPVASTVIGRRGALEKPVIAAWVIHPALQGIPFDEGTSGEPNFTYVTFTIDPVAEMQIFREVVPFDRLVILVSQGFYEVVPQLADDLTPLLSVLGIDTTVVPVGYSAEAALAAIPADIEAVWLAPLIELEPGGFEALMAGLIERDLPSFSAWGRSDVEAGALMSLYPDADLQRIARRIALHAHRIFDNGQNPSGFNVEVPRGQQLVLNMETARAVGVYPDWGVLTEAELINAERQEGIEWTMESVIETALEANLDILVSYYETLAGAEEIDQARAPLLPQLSLNAAGRQIDVDRAEASMGGQAQRTFSASIVLSQIIYSELPHTNLAVQEHLQEAREALREQVTLDIIEQAVSAYLNVLRANTAQRIQQDNLALTRSNLELARVQLRLGATAEADVYRWEAEIANNRRAVIDANARRNQAELQLNRILNREVEEHFIPQDIALEDDSLFSTAAQLEPYVGNPWSFRVFRAFMVEEAFDHAPELRQIDAAIAAQERFLDGMGRSYFIPTVGLEAEAGVLFTDGAGTEGLSIPGVMSPEADDYNWQVTLFLDWPLYTGGERMSEVDQAEFEVQRLLAERARVAQLIEQRVRSILHEAGAAYAGIELAQDAAEAAFENLRIVTRAYQEGSIAIPQLLDAQNASLVSDELAANAVYDYLLSFNELQRAVGQFDVLASPAEATAFFERLESFFETAQTQEDAPQ